MKIYVTMRKLLFLFIIFCSFSLNAQDEVSIKELLKNYEVKLELSKVQTSEFTLVLEKYINILNDKVIDNKSFNKNNKLRDLEFYKLLSKEQFNVYKKVKLEIEPTLKFRFN
jgi:Golgi nucleoside diphosphatase